MDGEGSTGGVEEDEGEDYINITVPPVENGSASEKSSSRDRLSFASSASDVRSNSSTPKKAFSSILSTPSGLFHRKKSRSESMSSKEGSEMTARFEKDEDGGKAALSTSPAERVRRRSKADIVNPVKDVKEPTKVRAMLIQPESFISLRSEQNGCQFADDIFQYIFLNKHFKIPNKISLKYVAHCVIKSNSALF